VRRKQPAADLESSNHAAQAIGQRARIGRRIDVKRD
jgi:hypothetical protein